MLVSLIIPNVFLSTWVLYLTTAYITPMMANLEVLLILLDRWVHWMICIQDTQKDKL